MHASAGEAPASRPATPPARGPRDLPSLTSLRALAALLIFANHLDQYGVVDVGGLWMGYVGVTFFFVLSGFILTWGYDRRLSVRRFYVRRVARIYPAHIATWAVALIVPVTPLVRDWWSSAPTFLLVQAWYPRQSFVYGMNAASWSLACEIAFYAAFPFLLRWADRHSLRGLVVVAAVWFLVVAVLDLVSSRSGASPTFELAMFSNPAFRFSEFLLGVATARAVQAGWRPRWPVVAGVVAVCAVGGALFRREPDLDVWCAPLFALLIVWCARRDSRGPNWLGARPLVYAGKLSFAFYLVHALVILNLQHALGRTGGAGLLLLITVVAVIGAMVVHHAVELPAQRYLVTRFGARRPVTSSDPVGA